MDHPASTNSNYVINNITTNITCMQVLTIVLLMICSGQTLACRCLAHLITNFQRCRHQPQCTCERVAGYCALHAIAHDGGRLCGHRHCLCKLQGQHMYPLWCGIPPPFSHPHKQESKGVKSGERADRISVTVQNQTHVHMNFFA